LSSSRYEASPEPRRTPRLIAAHHRHADPAET